jgi:hypothetical protein
MGMRGKDIVEVVETVAIPFPILSLSLTELIACVVTREAVTVQLTNFELDFHQNTQQHEDSSHQLTALIPAPTCKVALQVAEHLRAVIDPSRLSEEEPSGIRLAAVAGGMNTQKRKRLIGDLVLKR